MTIYADFTKYICPRCKWGVPEGTDNKEAYELTVDHIFSEHGVLNLASTPKIDTIIDIGVETFSLTLERAKILKEFFYANGYISSEFFPEVKEILRDLDRFLENK